MLPRGGREGMYLVGGTGARGKGNAGGLEGEGEDVDGGKGDAEAYRSGDEAEALAVQDHDPRQDQIVGAPEQCWPKEGPHHVEREEAMARGVGPQQHSPDMAEDLQQQTRHHQGRIQRRPVAGTGVEVDGDEGRKGGDHKGIPGQGWLVLGVARRARLGGAFSCREHAGGGEEVDIR